MASRRNPALSAWRSALRRLDFLPAAVALGGGVGLGVLVWALLAGKALAVQGPGWVALLGVAWWLAASAEPVAFEVAPAVAPSPEGRRHRQPELPAKGEGGFWVDRRRGQGADGSPQTGISGAGGPLPPAPPAAPPSG